MQEEANLDILHRLLHPLDLPPQHGWEEHKMVVMNPDEVVILQGLDNGLCKVAIGFLIGIPVRFIEQNFARVVVEERPQDGICMRVRQRVLLVRAIIRKR